MISAMAILDSHCQPQFHCVASFAFSSSSAAAAAAAASEQHHDSSFHVSD